MLLNQPVRQLAYYVDDVRAAATRHHEMFGSGPFFIAENLRQPIHYRGRDTELCTSTAFGQWGSMQIELMQASPDGPADILHELYPKGSGRYGLHHVAIIVDDFDAGMAEMKAAGFEEALRSYIPAMDMPAALVDAVATYGHFVELYPAVSKLVGFFDMVADAAKSFNGKQLFHEVKI